MSCWFILVILGTSSLDNPPALLQDLKPENFLFHTKDLCGRGLGGWGENTPFFFLPERVGFFVVFFVSEGDSSLGLLGGDLPFFFP